MPLPKLLFVVFHKNMKNDKIIDLDNHSDLKFPSSPDSCKELRTRRTRPAIRISFLVDSDDISTPKAL